MVKSNRAYTLVFGYLAGAIVLAIVAMLTNNPNWKFIMDWYVSMGYMVVVPSVAAKEIGKIGTSIAARRTGRRTLKSGSN